MKSFIGPTFRAVLVTLVITVTVRCVVAQAAAAGSPSKAHALVEQRAKIAEEIASLDAGSKEADTDEGGATKDQRQDRIAELRALDAIYAQHQVRLQERDQLEEKKKEVERAIDALDKFAPDEPKPYSFLLYDSLKDQLAVEVEKAKTLDADVKSAHKQLAAAHKSLDDSASEQKSPPTADHGEPLADLHGNLQVQYQHALVALRETEVEVNDLRAAICEARQKELSQKLKVIEKDVAFSAADRDKQLEAVAEASERLKAQRREVESQLQQVTSSESAAPEKLANARAGQAEQRSAVAAWQAAADAYESQLVILDERIEWQSRVRRLWRRRYEIAAKQADAARINAWRDDLTEFRDDLGTNISSIESRRSAVLATPPQAGAAAANTTPPPPAEKEGEETPEQGPRLQEKSSRQFAEFCVASIAEAHGIERLIARFDEELAAQLPETTEPWLGVPAVDRLLGYKIVGDDEHSVKFGTLVVLLFYVVAGVFVAWAVSRVFRMLILRHFRLHRGKADAIHSILFYSLCILFGVLAFRMLDIPLAAFAFLGGAAAIAVGFGSQDIMNNFMSGIILLAEQPIRVGDIVTLGKVSGVVLHIGLRSTRLQTEANHEVIVPNKTLLDEQITNFTLTDNIVQVSAVITLDRETKIAEAKDNILKVVFAHPVVVKSMQPLVLVKEIDNYWLTFEVRFWIQYNNFQQSAVVQSQIMEIVGDLYRPLTDEEKAAKAASATGNAPSAESSPEGDVPLEPEADLQPASANASNDSEPPLLQSAQAKYLSRKLIRKIAQHPH